MNRKRRVEMIVKILLSPYDADASTVDPLLRDKLRASWELARCQPHEYQKRFSQYSAARKELALAFQKQVHADRLSEVSELTEMFFPERELSKRLCEDKADLDFWYLERLLSLSTEFITLRDGLVSIKLWTDDSLPGQKRDELFPPDTGLYKVELWSEISRVITPDVLIAAYFVKCGIENPSYLKKLPDNISLSDSILSRLNRKGIAETHMHLASGMSYLSIWEYVTDLTALQATKQKSDSAFRSHQRKAISDHKQLVIAGWLRLLMARYLESGTEQDILAFHDTVSGEDSAPLALERTLLEKAASSLTEEDIAAVSDSFQANHAACCAYLRKTYRIDNRKQHIDILARGPYAVYQSLHTAPELMLLYFALWHIDKFPEHRNFTRLFLCYLRIKNQYFSVRFQSEGTSGLSFFRQYFREGVSSWNVLQKRDDLSKTQMLYQASFRNQFHCSNLKKLEVKISPPAIPLEPERGGGSFTLEQDQRKIAHQLLEVIHAFQAVMDEAGEQENIPTLGIVYHLLKPDIHHPSQLMCWVWPEDRQPDDYASRIRKQGIRFLHALQGLLRDIPGLPELVVGLDAASEEIYTEPWVYAPVYHAARNRQNTYPIQLSTGKPVQNLGLTYHVGEDYHHVLSGLRHIDEVLTYFGYKAGDRIGHGLVLQMDMGEWIYNYEVVSLPVMEYLEDLLWVWRLCGQDAVQMTDFLPRLEHEIMRVAEELYENIRGLSPHVLWRAYRAKFQTLSPELCEAMCGTYLKEAETEPPTPPLRLPSQRSFCALVDSSAPDTVWDAQKLLMTHHCPIFAPHYRKPILIYNSRDYLPLLQAVQAHIRKKVQNMGIYVEANPTSNIMIGDTSSLRQYSITRLNDPSVHVRDSASVLLSINSDNPLVFNTNVENELSLVYHTLNHQGLNREMTLQWIDKVRQYGMDSSFIRTVKTAEEQRRFLHGIEEHLCAILGRKASEGR